MHILANICFLFCNLWSLKAFCSLGYFSYTCLAEGEKKREQTIRKFGALILGGSPAKAAAVAFFDAAPPLRRMLWRSHAMVQWYLRTVCVVKIDCSGAGLRFQV